MNFNGFNKKKTLVIIGIIVFIILIVLLISLYISQKEFRDWIDVNILGKNITQEDVATIKLNTDKTNQIYAYGRYLAILNDRKVTLYNNYGNEVSAIEVNINTAIFNSNDRYLVVAEENGREVCLIYDQNYLWSNTVEGEILQVAVNKSGYVAIIYKDSTYKSIIKVYDFSGKEVFTSYFADTRIIDVSISKDSKYVALAEIDTSGAVVQSNIKIIPIENAQNDPENAISYTYNADAGKMIINIEYQEENKIVCMYDSSISVLKDEQNTEIITINDENTFMAIDFDNNIVYTEEDNSLFLVTTNIKIVNTDNNKTNTYIIEETAKEIYAKENIIAINLGTEVHFINTSGWLIKKYNDRQEITNITFSNQLAGIIYKDEVIIIDL